MRKTTNMPIDKHRLDTDLIRRGFRQADIEKRLRLKRGTIANIRYRGSANPKIIEALEKEIGIRYDDIRPLEVCAKTINDAIALNQVEIPKQKSKPLASVQVDADIIAEAVKEGMKQFWQECGNDILRKLEDVIFTGNYDARRRYTSQDLTYDLHKCWNTDKGYADLPEVQAILRRKK